MGLGCVAVLATGVSDAMMLAAARGLAHKVTQAELAADSVLPRIERIRSVASLGCHMGTTSKVGPKFTALGSWKLYHTSLCWQHGA